MSEPAKELRTLYKSELAGSIYQPTRSPEAQPFWEGCREQRLMLPQCTACKRFHFYPRAFCPYCDSREIAWVRSQGTGTVYSFAVVRQKIEPAFAHLIPYAIAIVDLSEGVRMLSRIEGPPDKVACGKPVRVTFETLSPALTLPLFQLS